MAPDPAAVFRPGGRLAAVIAGYEHRPQQEAMASRVWQALSTGHNLVIEAGTGVGKSLAYLVPAAIWAREQGRRVAISTYTRLLQAQLSGQDIPLLNELVEAPPAAVAYGQENYLCRFRLQARVAHGLFDTRAEADTAGELLDWSETTDDGILLLYPRPLSPQLGRRIGRDSAACRRADCPYFRSCFYYRARRRWDESLLLVVNHFLFFAGLDEDADVLPEIAAVVFDEAHRLEDAAVLHFGADVSRGGVSNLLDGLNPPRGRGLLHALGLAPDLLDAIEHEVDACRSAFATFFSGGWLPPADRVGRVRIDRQLDGVPVEAASRLAAILRDTVNSAGDEGLALELRGVARRLGETAGALTRFAEPDPEREVYWAENDERSGAKLSCAPLDVAPLLAEQVYPRYATTVLTSATLTVGGEFDFVADRLGLDRFRTCLLDSPFDYRRNSLLFVADRLVEPGAEGFVEAAAVLIERLLRTTRGRALVLFTSYDMMHRVRELVRGDGYTCLCQGELPIGPLLDRFRADVHSVLFATQSFWQGIDVPGEALTCLVIARLPFEVPDDPRLSAIAERLRLAGQQPFTSYQLPGAVLRFRQGFGRLIRTARDRGVICVLDNRIVRRPYGRAFLASLPVGLRLTTDFAELARFLDPSQTNA